MSAVPAIPPKIILFRCGLIVSLSLFVIESIGHLGGVALMDSINGTMTRPAILPGEDDARSRVRAWRHQPSRSIKALKQHHAYDGRLFQQRFGLLVLLGIEPAFHLFGVFELDHPKRYLGIPQAHRALHGPPAHDEFSPERPEYRGKDAQILLKTLWILHFEMNDNECGPAVTSIRARWFGIESPRSFASISFALNAALLIAVLERNP
jgi:hypothetical protein